MQGTPLIIMEGQDQMPQRRIARVRFWKMLLFLQRLHLYH